MFFILFLKFAPTLSNYTLENFPHDVTLSAMETYSSNKDIKYETSGYATWFTAGGAIRIAHYDVIDDVITRKV